MNKVAKQVTRLFKEDEFDIILQTVIVLDPAGILRIINKKGCDTFGVSRKKVLNKDWFELFISAEDQDVMRSLFIEAIKMKRLTETFENEIVCHKREKKTIRWHASFVNDNDGDISGLLCSGEDITELRTNERKLRESEENYRRLIDNISQVVFNVDFKKDLWASYPSFVSDRVLELTGYTADEFRNGKVVYQKEVHPKDNDEVALAFWKMIEEKKPVNRTYRFRHKSGVFKWFEDTLLPRFNGEGKAIGCFGVLSEITERKFFQAAIRDYEKFFNMSLDMFCIAGTDGYFKKINASFERVLGFASAELLSKPFFDFVHPKDLENTRQELVKLSQGMPTVSFENRYQCKDGSYKWLSWNSYPSSNRSIVYAVARDISEQKAYQEKIRKNESFLNSVVENIPNMLFVKDANDLKFVRFNKAGEDLIGFSREEMIGKNDYDFFPKEEADFFTVKDREVIKGNKLVDIPEEIIQTKNKGERLLHTRKIPLFDEAGNPEYLVGISEDITEAKQAQEALQKSEEKYRDIVHLIQEGIWMIDGEGKTTFVNDEMAKILNYTSEEIIGKDIFDFMDEEGIEIARKNIAKRKKGVSETHDFKFKTKDGAERWTILNARPITDTKGNYIGSIAAVVDVTERRRIEELIRENVRKLKEAQRIARVGSWEFEIERDVIHWSDETFRLFGLEPMQRIITREEYRSHIHPDDREMVLSHVNAALGGTPFEIEMRVIWPNGSLHYLVGRCQPIFKNGKVVKLSGTGMDITEQKMAEIRIMKALVEGQDIERRRIADDLHDSLGQKLSAIKLLIENAGYSEKNIKEDLHKLESRLNEAIEEVRNISHNLMPSALGNFGLTNVLRDLCNKLDNKNGTRVRFQAFDVKKKIDASIEFGIYRIAQELTNNAIRHAHAKEINLQLFGRDQKLILTIEDDGKGFNGKKTNFENTFGLNSITSRAKALNGIFTIDSQGGKGTMASIEIPLEK